MVFFGSYYTIVSVTSNQIQSRRNISEPIVEACFKTVWIVVHGDIIAGWATVVLTGFENSLPVKGGFH